MTQYVEPGVYTHDYVNDENGNPQMISGEINKIAYKITKYKRNIKFKIRAKKFSYIDKRIFEL